MWLQEGNQKAGHSQGVIRLTNEINVKGGGYSQRILDTCDFKGSGLGKQWNLALKAGYSHPCTQIANFQLFVCVALGKFQVLVLPVTLKCFKMQMRLAFGLSKNHRQVCLLQANLTI